MIFISNFRGEEEIFEIRILIKNYHQINHQIIFWLKIKILSKNYLDVLFGERSIRGGQIRAY